MVETIAFVILSLGAARAAEPIPFAQKLTRQTELDTDHAWRAGERVSAPVFSHCESALTLTVAPDAPGGLRLFKHSDHFVIEDSDAHLAKIRDWRGKTYRSVLEIIAPVTDRTEAENAQTYRARVVALEPPEIRVNPNRDQVLALKKNEQVILLGKVVELTDKVLKIRAQKFSLAHIYTVELRGGAPILEDDLSDTIRTLTGRERLEVGDYVHLKAYFNGGALRTEARRSSVLDYPGPRRQAGYARERHIVRTLTTTLITHLRQGDWAAARMTDAALQTHPLTPVERGRLERLRLKIPGDQRALVFAADDLGDIEVIDRTFDFDLDVVDMTMESLKGFADRWAHMKVATSATRDDDVREQTVLFGVLRKVGVDEGWIADLATTAARQRLRYFELRGEVGIAPQPGDWREMINLVESLRYLGHHPTPANVEFLISTAVQLAYLEHQGWSYAGRFLKPAFEVLNRQVNFARADRTPAGRAMRATFAGRAGELRAALEDVKAGRDLDGPSSPSMHILRFVLEIADAW